MQDQSRSIVDRKPAPLRRVWEHYTAPLITIDDPLRRRRVRLLASLLITTMLTIIAIAVWLILAPKDGFPFPQLASSAITFFLVLILLAMVRRGHERYAIAILVVSGSLVLLGGALLLGGEPGLDYLNYLVVVTVFGGLFLPVRTMLAVIAFQLIGMVIVGLNLRDVPMLLVLSRPMLFTTTISAILLVVTEHWRRTEREQYDFLAASEAQYRLLVERSRDIIYSQDLNGKILTINGAVERMLGHAAAQTIGGNIMDFVHPDDVGSTRKFLGAVLRDLDVNPLEIRVRRKSGDYIWAEIQLSPIHQPEGTSSVAGVVRDITPRKAAEEALRHSDERHRLISELGTDYAFEVCRGPDGSFSTPWVMDSVQRVTGYTPQEIMSLTPNLSLYHPDDRVRVDQDVRRALAGEQTQGEYRVITKAGELRWVQVFRSPVLEPDGQVLRFYAIAEDVTERKYNAEQQVKLAVQRERMGLANLVVLAVSHDFRTALSTIETSRYLIGRSLDEASRAVIQRRLDAIHNGVRHLTEQIENLHLVSSLTDPVPRLFDWNRMVEGAITEFAPIAHHKSIKVIFEGEPGLPKMFADEEKLRHATGHLLKNALAHTPANGAVRIWTIEKNGYVRVSVRDTGPGIAPEKIEHIFDPFYKADQSRTQQSGGVGLGLTLVRMIAEAHQGQVTVESLLGQGSVFTLSVPINRPPFQPADPVE